MNICSYRHDEIVYDEETCPLCVVVDEIIKLKNEIEELKRENEGGIL